MSTWPSSTVPLPLTVLLNLTVNNVAINGGAVLHVFHNAGEVAPVSFAVPFTATAAGTVVRVMAQQNTFLYSGIALTIYKLGEIPTV